MQISRLLYTREAQRGKTFRTQFYVLLKKSSLRESRLHVSPADGILGTSPAGFRRDKWRIKKMKKRTKITLRTKIYLTIVGLLALTGVFYAANPSKLATVPKSVAAPVALDGRIQLPLPLSPGP